MRGTPDTRSGLSHAGDAGKEIDETRRAHLANRVGETVAVIRRQTALVPRAAVILGSGLGGVADRVGLDPPRAGLDGGADFKSETLPHWPRSTVHGHAGHLVLGYWRGTAVVVLRGRAHRYEGYGLDHVTFAVRVMRELGAPILFLTNAVGSMNPLMQPGSLMLVRDHLNFQGTRGLLEASRLQQARPTPVYSPRLIALLQRIAIEQKSRLEEGVLMGSMGPAYETAAEVNAARLWGADAACMSTVTEAVVAASIGFEVAAVSSVTNLATGLAKEKLTHADVTAVADRVAARLEALLEEAVSRAVGEES